MRFPIQRRQPVFVKTAGLLRSWKVSTVAKYLRVAHARGISEDQVRQLIAENTRPRFAGIFGEPGVNVLPLSMALERAAGSHGGTTPAT